jgi:hypothetical protein
MRRKALLILAMIAAACAPTPDPASPSTVAESTVPTPVVAGALLRVDAVAREWCGSIGGCVYFAELRGLDRPRQAELVQHDDRTLSSGDALPPTLPPGHYTLTLWSHLVSDVVVNGDRQLGPVDTTCTEAFTVTADQQAVTAAGTFGQDDCSLEITGS